MNIKKTVLATLDKCYATSIMELGGKARYVVATEGVGPCLAFSAEDHSVETVWSGPGGTMTMVPLPGTRDEFLATQDFVPTFQAKRSRIVHVRREAGAYSVEPVMVVPFLHRFDVVAIGGRRFFVGATLCEDKDDKDDWSKPGKVLVGELPDSIDGPFALKPAIEGITKNHGFCRTVWKGRQAFLVSGVEGIFALFVPQSPDGPWDSERVADWEVSDMAVCDIDGDGMPELATIEPFHGSKGRIYKLRSGRLEPIAERGYEFGHVVWGGPFLGRPGFLIGGRKGNMELNLFRSDASGRISVETIDSTGGPSNIAVRHLPGKEIILAANREIGEVALYELTD